MSVMAGAKIQEELNNIPLADDDPQVIIHDDNEVTDMGHMSEAMIHGRSLDSIPSTYTNGSSSPGPNKNETSESIHRRLRKVYGDMAVDKSTVSRWAKRLALSEQGRGTLSDLPRSGRPSTAVTPATVQRADSLIRDDRRITTRELAAVLGIGLDPDISPDEQEEKARLISQVLELQNTLDDLSQRVDSVKEENLKLRSENQVLGQYIENLMSASSVFQSTSPKTKKK